MAWGKLGLAALFFMAGVELDLERVRGRPRPWRFATGFCPSSWAPWWPLSFTSCRSCIRR